MINNLSLVGRVGAEPEIRHFESGKIKATFRVAINRPTKEKETDWFEVQCWAKQAEIVAEYVKKGHLVGIEGSLQAESWTSKDSGEKRSKVIVNARNIRLMQPKGDGTGGGESSSSTKRSSVDDDPDDIFSSEDELPF